MNKRDRKTFIRNRYKEMCDYEENRPLSTRFIQMYLLGVIDGIDFNLDEIDRKTNLLKKQSNCTGQPRREET
jgi:hypothetical protein